MQDRSPTYRLLKPSFVRALAAESEPPQSSPAETLYKSLLDLLEFAEECGLSKAEVDAVLARVYASSARLRQDHVIKWSAP